jgi:hypothetical protein
MGTNRTLPLTSSGIMEVMLDLFHLIMDQYKYADKQSGGTDKHRAESFKRGKDGKIVPMTVRADLRDYNSDEVQ